MAKKPASDLLSESKFPFTETRLEAARHAVVDGELETDGYGRRSWMDSDCPGLRVTVNARTGSSVFYFQAKQGKRTVRKALGDTDVVRLAEARDAVRRLRYDRSIAGSLVPRLEDGDHDDASSPLVSQVLDDMLDAQAIGRWLAGSRSKPPTDRTMQFYRDLRRAVMVEKVQRKRKDSDEIETVDGENYEEMTLREFAMRLPAIYAAVQKRAPIQANRALQLWRNLFSFAADADLWDGVNPTIGTTKTRRLTKTPEKVRTRWLTDAEWNQLDRAMRADDPLWRDLFTASILSLQRMGAVCRAQWANVTLTGADACWRIPVGQMKGRKSGHVVPISEVPELLELFRRRRKVVPKTCEWVFPALRGGGAVTSYKSAWRRILTRAGLWSEDKDIRPRPHDLRRTGGARMTEGGQPLQTVTRALGNAPSSAGMVAAVYAQVSDPALRQGFAATVKRRGRTRRG